MSLDTADPSSVSIRKMAHVEMEGFPWGFPSTQKKKICFGFVCLLLLLSGVVKQNSDEVLGSANKIYLKCKVFALYLL